MRKNCNVDESFISLIVNKFDKIRYERFVDAVKFADMVVRLICESEITFYTKPVHLKLFSPSFHVYYIFFFSVPLNLSRILTFFACLFLSSLRKVVWCCENIPDWFMQYTCLNSSMMVFRFLSFSKEMILGIYVVHINLLHPLFNVETGDGHSDEARFLNK